MCHAQQVLDTICVNMGIPSHLAVAHQPNMTYQWSVNGGQILGQTDTNDVLISWGSTPGLYKSELTVTDARGCVSDVVHAWIFLRSPNFATAKGPGRVCQGEPVTLFSNVPSDFVWQGGDTTRELTFTAHRDTTIMLVAINGTCGNDTLIYPVEVTPMPMATLSYVEDTVLLDDKRKLYYSGPAPDFITWFVNGQPMSQTRTLSLTFDGVGPYEIMQVVRNGNGCADTIRKTIYVESEFKVWIPNAFSPNGDGVNDLFYFDGVGIEKFTAQIYNRWGSLVYEWNENSPTQGWDGTTDSQMTSYVYKITIEDIRGRIYYYSDLITILR